MRPSTVAVTVLASLTLLPAFLGVGGRSHRANPLAWSLRRRFRRCRARWIWSHHPRDRSGGVPDGCDHDPRRLGGTCAEERGRAPPAQAPAADDGVPLEPDDPAPALAGRDRRQRRAAHPRRAASRPEAELLGREQLRRGHHHRRRTTCWSRASERASTVRCSWSPKFPRARPRRTWRPSKTQSRRTRRSALVVPLSRTTRTNPTAVMWILVPATGPQDEATTAAPPPPPRRRPASRLNRPRLEVLSPESPPPTSTSPIPRWRAHAVLLRRGARAVVPAADGRVPLAAGAAEGRDHEPAVDRRRLRRRRRGLPVGLAQRHHRRAARHRSSRGRR